MPTEHTYYRQSLDRLKEAHLALSNLNECINTETNTLNVAATGSGASEVEVNNFPSSQAITHTTLTNLATVIDHENAQLLTDVPVALSSSCTNLAYPAVNQGPEYQNALRLCGQRNDNGLKVDPSVGNAVVQEPPNGTKVMLSCDRKGRLLTNDALSNIHMKKVDPRISKVGRYVACGRYNAFDWGADGWAVPIGRQHLEQGYITGIRYGMYIVSSDAADNTQTLTIVYYTGVAATDTNGPTISTYNLDGTNNVPIANMVYIISATLNAACVGNVFLRHNGDGLTIGWIMKEELTLHPFSIAVPTLGVIILDKIQITTWGQYATAGLWAIFHNNTKLIDGFVAYNGTFEYDLSHIPAIYGNGVLSLGAPNFVYPAVSTASGITPTVSWKLYAHVYLKDDFTDWIYAPV